MPKRGDGACGTFMFFLVTVILSTPVTRTGPPASTRRSKWRVLGARAAPPSAPQSTRSSADVWSRRLIFAGGHLMRSRALSRPTTCSALRASAAAGAERLSADCPQDDPAPPWARAEAVERAIDTATSALVAVESPMQEFYAILDDEQKVRLLRDMMLSHSQAREGDRTAERSERRSRRRGDSDVGGEAKLWAGICERLNAALRGWPTREIERSVRLSEPQRVAFYKLVNSSLPVADALATGCPAETALTPPGRITQTRARLAAVRQAITAIWPAFTEFYEALDHGQKVRFAGMR